MLKALNLSLLKKALFDVIVASSLLIFCRKNTEEIQTVERN